MMHSSDLTRVLLVVVMGILVVFLPGCDRAPNLPKAEAIDSTEAFEACDDRVTPTPEPPQAAQDDGLEEGVGSGDMWFFAGGARWGDVVISDGAGFRGKFAMWVGQDELPFISVVSSKGDIPGGTVEMDETSDGLPGPLPATVRFPSKGCWTVTATLDQDTAQITVQIP